MKIKNIIFSGFAAAIFATVCGAASAADVALISKDYADAKLQAKLVADGNVTISEDNKIDVDLSNLATKDEVAKKLTGAAIEGNAVSFNEATSVYTITDNNTEYTGEGYVSVADNKITVTADGQVAENNTGLVTGGTVYAITSALDSRVTTAEADIKELDKVVDTLQGVDGGDEGIVTKVSNLESAVGDAESGLVKAVADLQTEMQGKQDALTADNVVSGSDNVTVDFADGVYTISATDTTYGVGTAETEGLTKLYAVEGEATDGTMTQAAIKTALATKADSDDLTALATKDEVATKVSSINAAGSYLVNFSADGAVSYAPIQILDADGNPITLTTNAVAPAAAE